MSHRDDVLVPAVDLAEALASPRPPVLLDVRWAVTAPDGRPDFLAGHLPGARFVDLDADLAGPADPALGRHPLPDLSALQDTARGWGIDDGDAVVVYDATGGLAAARAWWLLRWAGVADVRLLDGGLDAWAARGGDLETGEAAPVSPGSVTLTAGHLPVLDADAAAALAVDGVLLDARAAERYRGEVEPVDPRAGHVPGAVSAPTTGNLAADGTLLADADLTARFRTVGVEVGGPRVGVYCGSGVTAAHEIAALAVLGVDAPLYSGSWSQWSHDDDRPVAVGATPNEETA